MWQPITPQFRNYSFPSELLKAPEAQLAFIQRASKAFEIVKTAQLANYATPTDAILNCLFQVAVDAVMQSSL